MSRSWDEQRVFLVLWRRSRTLRKVDGMDVVHTLDVNGCYHMLVYIQNYAKGRTMDQEESVVKSSVGLRHNKIHVALDFMILSVSKSAIEADVELFFWRINIHEARSVIIAPL
jgi:hypothetical protein